MYKIILMKITAQQSLSWWTGPNENIVIGHVTLLKNNFDLMSNEHFGKKIRCHNSNSVHINKHSLCWAQPATLFLFLLLVVTMVGLLRSVETSEQLARLEAKIINWSIVCTFTRTFLVFREFCDENIKHFGKEFVRKEKYQTET